MSNALFYVCLKCEIEILQQEFIKMLHVTENMDRKHVEMVAEMQRKHDQQLRQMEFQRRQEQLESTFFVQFQNYFVQC